MLFKATTLDGVRTGAITCAFRRWQRARVKAGSRVRTQIGVVEITSIKSVAENRLTTRDARAAGFDTLGDLRSNLSTRDGTIFRIGVRYGGADERIALRSKALRSKAAFDVLHAKLERKDRRGPWTRAWLEMIEGNEGVRAPDLAARVGFETRPFKARVRQLKELGLTESLKVGYRLSKRGASYLKRLRSG